MPRWSRGVSSLVLAAWMLAAFAPPGTAQTTTATGPLRVHSTNARYFVDPSGRTVYLTGSHTWNNFQDGNGAAFDFTAYLNLIKSHNHNFIRLWVSESPRADVGVIPAPGWNGTSPWYQTVAPLPYARTGTGTATDGQAKFDLTQWNQAYFDRLRARVIAARDRGIYVGIMLFNYRTAVNRTDLYPGRNAWRFHPFQSNNNMNGISGDPNGNGLGEETHSLQVPAITQLQEAYVRKVVDTVNDLDNVLFEISNEDVSNDPAWQNQLINVIKSYEAGKPKQHPVGMTGSPQIDASLLFSQPGNWTSPAARTYDNSTEPYASNPPAADGLRVSLLDSDHIGYMLFRDNAAFTRAWVWKSFLRGHHTLMIEDLGGNAGWTSGRAAMGHTRSYATRMNLGAMTPQGTLSSTGYTLASIGNEYLVYQDGSGAFSVNVAANSYAYEWFNPATGTVAATGTVGAFGGSQTFTPPFAGPALLYLKASGVTSDPAMSSLTTASTTTTSFQASTDFSGVQGQRGWFYQDSLGRLMTYNATGNYWQGAETYLTLGRTDAHPGNTADAVRRWVASAAGTVRITGRLADNNTSCGGGITAFIRQGSAVLWQQALANGNSIGVTFDVTATVSAGTALDFVLNRGADGSWDCDATSFDPLITYGTGGSTSPTPSSPTPTSPTPTSPTPTPTAPTPTPTPTPTSPSTSTTGTGASYRASTDFSGVQGQRGWFYQDSLGRLMTYNATGAYWQGAETYLTIARSDAHPGNAVDAVRRWVAPTAGTVRITGLVADRHSACGGGVTAFIRQGSAVLWQQALANGNSTGVTFDVTATVSAGTALDFVLNRGADGSWDCDATSFDPLITYGTTGTPSAPTPTPTPTTSTGASYRASTDFSGTQGQRGWYYQDSLGRMMTYNGATGSWQGAEAYLLLSRSAGHPGNAADAVRRWVAPSAGSVRITGKVLDQDVRGGGGITAAIRNGTTILWQQPIANGNTAGISFDVTTTVSVGAALDFVIHRGSDGNNSYDSTEFDPLITYTTATSAPSGTVAATLTWNANTEPDLAGYRIYQRTATGTYGSPISLGKVTSYMAANLVSGTRYYFKVSAVDTSGNESTPSLEVSIQK